MMPRWSSFVAAIMMFALAFANAVEAHPHVWVTMKTNVMYGVDGTVTEIHYSWAFDAVLR